jgi:TetR/AcrR family transcriptional regulator, tetracycline repressor protein
MGRPQIITREKVAEVALRVLDEDGLDALSLERIAQELGVRGPSLYYHFADKSDILSEVARLVVGDLALDHDAPDWRRWLIDNALLFYRRVKEHPNAAAIILEFLPASSSIPGFGRAAKRLTDAGVASELQVLLMEGAQNLAWGWALYGASTASRIDGADSPSRLARRWPELAEARRANPWDDEAMLEAALIALFAGILQPTS